MEFSYLNVFSLCAEDIKDDTSLVYSGWTVAPYDSFAQADTLIGRHKFVQNVFAVVDPVFDDPLFSRMSALDESVQNGYSVSEARTADNDGFRINTVEDRTFQDG